MGSHLILTYNHMHQMLQTTAPNFMQRNNFPPWKVKKSLATLGWKSTSKSGNSFDFFCPIYMLHVETCDVMMIFLLGTNPRRSFYQEIVNMPLSLYAHSFLSHFLQRLTSIWVKACFLSFLFSLLVSRQLEYGRLFNGFFGILSK